MGRCLESIAVILCCLLLRGHGPAANAHINASTHTYNTKHQPKNKVKNKTTEVIIPTLMSPLPQCTFTIIAANGRHRSLTLFSLSPAGKIFLIPSFSNLRETSHKHQNLQETPNLLQFTRNIPQTSEFARNIQPVKILPTLCVVAVEYPEQLVGNSEVGNLMLSRNAWAMLDNARAMLGQCLGDAWPFAL